MDRKTNIIWAAGFMDGEGTITIKRSKPATTQSMRYQVCVSCTQVVKPENEKAIYLFQKLFGGSVCKYTQKPENKNWIDSVQWSVVSLKATACIKELLPYLKIKQPQAKIALQFAKNMTRYIGRKPIPLEELGKREAYFWKMRQFNVKGKIRLQRLNEGTLDKGDVIV